MRTAIINKRAGGMGLISGRKAFQRPMADGVKLLHAIQDVILYSVEVRLGIFRMQTPPDETQSPVCPISATQSSRFRVTLARARTAETVTDQA